MDFPALTDRDTDHTKVTAAVIAITALALLARFILLGDRVAHWDEARVGFWTLDYIQTGNFEYRPVLHGPFYHHINPIFFEWFGVTDATMRYAPALVTGLLPLTALLFRARLDGLEITALAGFLAFDPILLYYSRFMRGDPLVAAFMFAGFAFLVRLIDTGRSGHLLAASGVIALGFTAKENAFVYVLCWLGALAVVLDHRLVTTRYHEYGWQTVVGEWSRRGMDWVSRHAIAVCMAIFEFFVVIAVFYGQRSNGRLYVPGSNGGEYVGANALVDPLLLGRFFWHTTVGAFQSFYSFWGDGSRSEHAYLPYLVDLLETINYGSFVLVVLAVLGFVVYRYTTDDPHDLVTVTFAWGLASLFGYPVITDIKAPWAAVHVVLPLMIPAAVGAAAFLRHARETVSQPRLLRAGTTVMVLLVIVVPIAYVGVHNVYESPQSADNQLVQYAQPADELHPTINEVERIAQNNQGNDVMLYGSQFVRGDPIYQRPSCAGNEGWFDALPLPWYFERSDAAVTCVQSESALANMSSNPPVVIAGADHVNEEENGEPTPVVPDELESRFEGYDATIKRIRTTDTDVVFLIDRDRVNATQSSELSAPERVSIS